MSNFPWFSWILEITFTAHQNSKRRKVILHAAKTSDVPEKYHEGIPPKWTSLDGHRTRNYIKAHARRQTSILSTWTERRLREFTHCPPSLSSHQEIVEACSKKITVRLMEVWWICTLPRQFLRDMTVIACKPVQWINDLMLH